jgi:hypothetical protein
MKELLQELSKLGEQQHSNALYLASVARCLKANGIATRCVNLAAQKLIDDTKTQWECAIELARLQGGRPKSGYYYLVYDHVIKKLNEGWPLDAAFKSAESEFGKTTQQVKGVYYAEMRKIEELDFAALD